jgi:uncharacterized protein (DUF305 family)
MDANYKKLGIVVGINTVVMFLLTYALIDRWDHFYVNLNRVYMALMMVAPMVIVMLVVMASMYENRRLNRGLFVALGVVFVGSFLLARTQTPVGNEQFLRSMIPHHSSAIVMCEHAAITDPEIIDLCDEIVEAQEREIAQMKDILGRM